MSDATSDPDDEYEDDDIGPFGTNGDNLEGLARHALSRLNGEKRETIGVADYPELEELIMELADSSSAYYSEFAKRLSFQPAVISKFLKFKGQVRTSVARKLADRLITYLRTEEAAARPTPPRPVPPTPFANERKPDLVIAAVGWKLIRRTDELQEKIAELVRLINEVTRHLVTSNLPEAERALTEVERAQLVAVLETVLRLLKAPMVEKGLVKKAAEMLKKAASRAVEEQVEEAFAFAAGFAAGKLSHLVGQI